MSHGIPITYVPARNTIFLSLALAWAQTLGANDIYIGVNALDYSGYPDCRPEYLAAYAKMADLATKAGVEGTQGSGASTGCARDRRILGRPIDSHATARSQSVRSDLSLRGRPRPSEN
jgi:7-cyano-7-deazaguanine synthase in queuosine biosynthesis